MKEDKELIDLGSGFDFEILTALLRRCSVTSDEKAITVSRVHNIGNMQYKVNSIFPKDIDTSIADNIELLVRKNIDGC